MRLQLLALCVCALQMVEIMATRENQYGQYYGNNYNHGQTDQSQNRRDYRATSSYSGYSSQRTTSTVSSSQLQAERAIIIPSSGSRCDCPNGYIEEIARPIGSQTCRCLPIVITRRRPRCPPGYEFWLDECQLKIQNSQRAPLRTTGLRLRELRPEVSTQFEDQQQRQQQRQPSTSRPQQQWQWQRRAEDLRCAPGLEMVDGQCQSIYRWEVPVRRYCPGCYCYGPGCLCDDCHGQQQQQQQTQSNYRQRTSWSS